MIKKHWENLYAFLLSTLGLIFLIYYIFRSSTDVVSSDYIRIIDYYLDDVKDLKYLFSWESISRIPVTFLARFVNKEYFNYSVFFDKILGTFGLFLFNFVTIKFILNTLKSNIVKIIASIVVSFISFSLISWEMILNGTGYPHLLTVGLISLIFYLFDRIVKRTKNIMTLENLDSSDLKYYGNEKENNRLSNMVALIDTSETQRNNLRAHALVYFLVIVTSLLFSGSYAVSFLCVIIFFSFVEIFVFIAIRNKYNKGEIDSLDKENGFFNEFKDQYNSQEIRSFGLNKGEKYSTVNNETTFKIIIKFTFLIIISFVCLACYFRSNATGEPLIPVGTYDIDLFTLLKDDIRFPIRFLLKSLAGSVIGVETFDYAINFKTINENMIFIVGFIYVAIILLTIFILIVYLVNKKHNDDNIFDINSYNNVFPFMYIVIGIANYLLVFLARYKFLRDEYGMSSRYGIQYMFLTIGLIIIHLIFIDDIVFNKKYFLKEKERKLSKTYLKRRENLIAKGKIKPDEKKPAVFVIITLFISIISVGVLTFGHITTTIDEIYKADYRKIVYGNLENIAKNYTEYTDEELMNAFEYHRDVKHIKHALTTLKTQKLNIFKE